MVSKIKYQKQFGGKHVLITGGSEGIGLALAQSFVRAHAHVTVVARSQAKLDAAKSSLEGLATEVASTSRINIESADVTNPQQVSDAVRSAQQAIGPIDVLVCNAGMALPGYFHEQSLDVFRQHMDVNYFGCVNTVKAVYDGMVARNAGRICLMSSTLGLMGIVGYTGYCGSKYAVRGFADALRNELVGTEVSVSIMFPPDTKTPGFEHENTMKPPETAEISAGADLVSPEKVADYMMSGIAAGRYMLGNPDLGIAAHAIGVQGMLPRRFPHVLLEMLLGCILPVVHMVYAGIFDRIARKGASKRFAKLWSTSAPKDGAS